MFATALNAAPPAEPPVPWPQRVEWIYRNATQVFVGKVSSVIVRKEADGTETQVGRVELKEVLKGPAPAPDLRIYKTIPPPTDSFVPFVKEGTTVLVFASPQGELVRLVKEDDASHKDFDPPVPFAKAMQRIEELRGGAKP